MIYGRVHRQLEKIYYDPKKKPTQVPYEGTHRTAPNSEINSQPKYINTKYNHFNPELFLRTDRSFLT